MNDDLRILAIWITAAAVRKGTFDVIRKIIKESALDAEFVYGTIKKGKSETFHDPEGVRQIIADFASAVDEHHRNILEDK